MVSEKLNHESRFKESFIALLCFAEIGSWITLCIFVYFKFGFSYYLIPPCAAVILYIMLNLIHACVHRSRIIKNSLDSYKNLELNHKCNFVFVRVISFIVSYKFSLLLVSYLYMKPRYSGDYSKTSWFEFNKISLSFICLPYPIMMLSSCYYLYMNGIYSYTGFIAIEVICISTVSTMLLFIDAISVLRCLPKESMSTV